MVDVMSAAKRSALMSRIRARDTRPEISVRHYLWHAGFRYRLCPRNLPGKPDLVLPKWRKVVLVHGCFWHQHAGCPYFRLPKTRTPFWANKLRKNRCRDLAVVERLAHDGWGVAVVWECALKLDPGKTGAKLAAWIVRGKGHLEVDGRTGKIRTGSLELLPSRRCRKRAELLV